MRLFFALIYLTAVAYAQSPPPAITSVSPGAIDAGGPAVTVTVSINAYVPGAVLKWSGTPVPTTYVNDTTLSGTVPEILTAICGKYFLTVTNPQTNAVSNSYAVIVNPVLKSLSPNVLPAGNGGVTVTASGLGFSSNVYLTLIASFTRTDLNTTYSGPTTLSAFVPGSAFNGAYPVSLFVTDPVTGAVSQTLPITLTFASVSAISPETIQAGIAAFTLSVGGANFVSGATVMWNDTTPLATRVNSSTFLSATVPAPLVHDAGDAFISVKNPGAPASNSKKLVIGPNPNGTTIISLSPPSAIAGGPAFTLTVTGERFVRDSTVLWFNTALSTTFVSDTQLTAAVPANLIASDGEAFITVSTPGVAPSNRVSLRIIAVTPTISSMSPASAIVGGPAFTMTVNGDGYIPASQVTGLAGATTTYVSLNRLTVSVPASAIASVGLFVIRVVNPGPVPSTEAPIFAVKAPAPSITALSPASGVAGGPDFTLTVNGAAFAANSTVQWNSAPLVTTFVSAGQLTARVPAALIAAAGTASVTVAADGALSNALSFTIAPSAPPTPVTSSAGIVNAASLLPAIAPGTLIAIYGSNLATVTAQAPDAPLPVLLGGTSVSINGTPAPLLYVSPVQVNAQVPYEIKVGTARLVVQSNGVPSSAVNFEVAATGPGVFTSQENHVVALNLADGTTNAAQTPARPGQYVTAYLTGQGLVDPPVTTGDAAPASPLSVPVAGHPVQVRIGGVVAGIQFAGLAPGFVGVLQMNVLVPDVGPGQLSFDVSVGGVPAAPTVISIASK